MNWKTLIEYGQIDRGILYNRRLPVRLASGYPRKKYQNTKSRSSEKGTRIVRQCLTKRDQERFVVGIKVVESLVIMQCLVTI
jgi:hypothetical protein